ncbi:MAG: hypothetical protein WC071_00760 [Victivallaceae bacterium]
MAQKVVNKKALGAEISNSLMDDFDRFEHLAITYWKQILWACVLIVVVVAVVVSFLAWQAAADKQAADVLANAGTEQEIIKAVQEYGNNKAARYARLRLASMYIEQKQFDKAFEQFKLIASSGAPDEMLWQTRLAEAYALELAGRFQEAVERFAEIGRDSFLPEAFRCEANYSAGRISVQLKDTKNAEKYLLKAKNALVVARGQQPDFAVDFWQRQAKFMLNVLNSGDTVAAVNPVAKATAVAAAKAKKK